MYSRSNSNSKNSRPKWVFDKKTEYKTSPVDQAAKYKDHGFKNLHIVDLDGALTGETVNIDIIQEIVSKFDFRKWLLWYCWYKSR